MSYSMLDVLNAFKIRFNSEPILLRAPGRVNIIGEHTDYNNGYVLPAAIDKNINFAIAKNDLKGLVRIHAINPDEYCEFKLEAARPETEGWLKFIMAITDEFLAPEQGFDCVFGGDLPVGGGVSSSSALTVGLAAALNQLFEFQNDPIQLVKRVQNAEANYTGVRGGIMDQFTIAMGKKESVILLDCQSLEYQYFPLELGDYTLLLCNTNIQHQLANTEYNTRREECEAGVKFLQYSGLDVKSLRDVSLSTINLYRHRLDPVIFNRCYFVIKENERVLEACKALQNNDLKTLGALLYASHEGLQEEYKVSCKELDFLVEKSRGLPAILGARMMGGGFGGCTINLVEKNQVDAVVDYLSQAYFNQFDLEMNAIQVEVGNGVFM